MSNEKEGMLMQQEEKHGFVPKLRFPEFRDAGGWIVIEIRSISQLVTERVGSTVCTPYTITSGVGLISQEEKLGRTIAGNSLKNYIVLQKNDFAYNKSATKAYPQGFIATYLGNERAAVPNSIFTCFRVNQKQVIPAFLDALFANNLHGTWLRTRIAVGARAHGSLQVSDDDLMTTPVPLPSNTRSLEEQQKIADCLTSLDGLITLEVKKLDAIKAHKNGLMQQLFPADGETLPKLRFPEFREAGEWTQMPLSKVCDVLQGYGFPVTLQGKTVGKYPFCKVSDISRGVAESGGVLTEAANYVDDEDLRKLRAKPIPKGATVFAKIGEALRLNRRAFVQRDCLIDNNATGLKAIDGAATDYFVYLLSQRIDLNKHCGGAVPSVNKSTLEEIEVIVPDPDEQKQIADCLGSLDDAIAVQSRKVETLKSHKKGLMQQLFPVLDEVQE